MVRRRRVRSAEEVEEFVRNQLAWSVIPADGVALLGAHRAAAAGDRRTVVAIDRGLHALKLPAELRAASCQAGRRLLAETASFVPAGLVARYRADVAAGEAPERPRAYLARCAAEWVTLALARHRERDIGAAVFCAPGCHGAGGAAARARPALSSTS